MSMRRELVGFQKGVNEEFNETAIEFYLFEKMFNISHLDGPYICSEFIPGRVELYYRFSRWRGRGEHVYDDYSDSTLVEYDLKDELSDPERSSYISSLLSRVKNDGAVTVPISRHIELLHYLLWTESCIVSCSSSYFLKSKLLRAFLDYGFIILNGSEAFAITKKGKSVAEYDYKAISTFFLMRKDYFYPCCLNLLVTQVLIEHPEALIRINDSKEFRYVLINLNMIYQRSVVTQKMNRHIFAFNNGIPFRDIDACNKLDEDIIVGNDTTIWYPGTKELENIIFDFC